MRRAPRPPQGSRRAGPAAALALALAAGAAAAEPCDVRDGWRACFAAPTDRYPHGIFGDLPNWGRLTLSGPDGSVATVDLPETRVFEDLAPRLADIGGDGAPEIVVVESDADLGAQLALYAPRRGGLAKVAATPEIGVRFRWLAPAAIADLDGDGVIEIAYVDRPHLAGVLRVWTFAPGGLTEAASAAGFSNHRIGDARILSGLRDCGGVREVVLPDFDWTRLVAVRLRDGRLALREAAPEASLSALAAALAC